MIGFKQLAYKHETWKQIYTKWVFRSPIAAFILLWSNFSSSNKYGDGCFWKKKNNCFLYNFSFSKSSQPLPASLPSNSTFPPVRMNEFSLFLPTAFFRAKPSGNKCFRFLISYYLLNTLHSVYQHLHLALPSGHLSIFIFLNLWGALGIFLFLTFTTLIFFLLLQPLLLRLLCLLAFFFLPPNIRVSHD